MRDPHEMLGHWPQTGSLRPAEDGLINQTWLVGTPPAAVLQWVNPIFSPRIQDDIAAVTAHLAERGVLTPRLLAPTHGAGWGVADPDGGSWRLMTFIPGETLHRTPDVAVAQEAGAMLARFHAALADLGHTWKAPARDIHNTPARMAELEAALQAHRGHALYGRAAPLGEALLAAWGRWVQRWGAPGALRRRICHGDPKLSNLRFQGPPWRAVCMLDLDTVGPGTLSAELGDAWRSWCNPGGEDDPRAASLDEAAFAAAARGYLSAAPADMDAAERESLAPGLERICLELAARFCADALQNNYFREDRVRWPMVGEHNLLRAEGQHHLAVAAAAAQARCVAAVMAVR